MLNLQKAKSTKSIGFYNKIQLKSIEFTYYDKDFVDFAKTIIEFLQKSSRFLQKSFCKVTRFARTLQKLGNRFAIPGGTVGRGIEKIFFKNFFYWVGGEEK